MAIEQKTSLVVQPFQELQRDVLNNEFTKNMIQSNELSQGQIEALMLVKLCPLMQKQEAEKWDFDALSVAQTIHKAIQYQKRGHDPQYLHMIPFKDKKTGKHKVNLIPDVRVDIKVVLDAYLGEMDRISTFVVTKDEIENSKYTSQVAPRQELNYQEDVLALKEFKAKNIKITNNKYYDDVEKNIGEERVFGILVVAYDKKSRVMNFRLYRMTELVAIEKRSSNYFNGKWSGTLETDFQAMIEKTAIKKFCKFLYLNSDSIKQSKMSELISVKEEQGEDILEGETVIETAPELASTVSLPLTVNTEKLPSTSPKKGKIHQKVSQAPTPTDTPVTQIQSDLEAQKKEYFKDLKPEDAVIVTSGVVATKVDHFLSEHNAVAQQIEEAKIPEEDKAGLRTQLEKKVKQKAKEVAPVEIPPENNLSEVDPNPFESDIAKNPPKVETKVTSKAKTKVIIDDWDSWD